MTEPKAIRVTFENQLLTVYLSDGRIISVPLAWYPRLLYGTDAERSHYSYIAGGVGLHWEELDEDLGVEGFLLGRPSGESETSFGRWLAKRQAK